MCQHDRTSSSLIRAECWTNPLLPVLRMYNRLMLNILISFKHIGVVKLPQLHAVLLIGLNHSLIAFLARKITRYTSQ